MSRDDVQGLSWCIVAIVIWGGFVACLARPGYTWPETAGWVLGSYIAIFAVCWLFAQLGNFGAVPVVVVERDCDKE